MNLERVSIFHMLKKKYNVTIILYGRKYNAIMALNILFLNITMNLLKVCNALAKFMWCLKNFLWLPLSISSASSPQESCW